MKKFIILILVIVAIWGVYYLLNTDSEIPSNENLTEVSLFFIKSGTEDIVAVLILVESENIERNTLEKLLEGPREPEKFFSLIPKETKIQSFRVEDKTAYADFSEELDRGIGGSTQVLAIRDQIERTLKQFENIEEVVISINGRVEDILQP